MPKSIEHRPGPQHDHDAGEPAELLDRKAALREEVWQALEAADAARFPGAGGRIPNFVGAEAAADRLRGTDAWRAARTVKANPDSPQWPVRRRALEDGKTVFMAVPRLAGPEPFFLLDPARLAGSPREASSIKGASRSARPVGLDELEPFDLVVAGCVAVGEDGARQRVIPTRPGTKRRGGRIRWDELTEDKIAAIPLLQRLRRNRLG